MFGFAKLVGAGGGAAGAGPGAAQQAQQQQQAQQAPAIDDDTKRRVEEALRALRRQEKKEKRGKKEKKRKREDKVGGRACGQVGAGEQQMSACSCCTWISAFVLWSPCWWQLNAGRYWGSAVAATLGDGAARVCALPLAAEEEGHQGAQAQQEGAQGEGAQAPQVQRRQQAAAGGLQWHRQRQQRQRQQLGQRVNSAVCTVVVAASVHGCCVRLHCLGVMHSCSCVTRTHGLEQTRAEEGSRDGRKRQVVST